VQIMVAEDLRKPIYMNVAWRALDLRQLLVQMSSVNWEVRDIMSQHSPYVDFILRVNPLNYNAVIQLTNLNISGASNIQHETY